MGLEITNRLKGLSSPRGLEGLVKEYLRLLGLPRATLGVLLCGPRESRRLNRRFLGRPGAADILSFPALRGRPRRNFKGYLGELALCPREVKRRFPRFARTLSEEAAFLLLHGVLHLTGRHHDSPAQERLTWKIQLGVFRKAGPRVRRFRLGRREAHAL
jgi:probable rRNA maturation factor